MVRGSTTSFGPEGSSSMSVISKKEISDTHFRWDSLTKFLYLANNYSHHALNFDIFSKITGQQVRVIEFIVLQILIGMPYMFMDAFIKLYTRRIDGFKFLNPLLKGISFGQFMQTAVWVILQSTFLADAVRYSVMILRSEVPWAQCSTESQNSSCLSTNEIFASCSHKTTVGMKATASHHLYMKIFSSTDRGVVTTRCFIVGMVWLANFFISSVTEETLLKIFYFSFVFRSVSTVVVQVILTLSVESEPTVALVNIMDANTEFSWLATLSRVQPIYGVGFLGFYDFGTMSPYTMVDTAVMIFSVVLILFALLRSWIIKVLFMKMASCVRLQGKPNPHYFIFAIFPLSTEFIRVHKLYVLYMYTNIMVTVMGYLTMQTLTMSKLLHTEFRSLKNLYLVGLISCCGCVISLGIAMQIIDSTKIGGFLSGLNMAALYIASFKVAIIMWVYGVQRFSTDIEFWLGFKPTKYWTLTWVLLPIFFVVVLIYKVYYGLSKKYILKVVSYSWFAATFIIITISHIKTISKYLVQNNLASLFMSTIKYGPPDPSDRRNRRNYSETIQLRHCKHSCQVIDDIFDCNHMPLLTSDESRTSSIESLTKDIYKAEEPIPETIIKHPSLLDIQHHHF